MPQSIYAVAKGFGLEQAAPLRRCYLVASSWAGDVETERSRP